MALEYEEVFVLKFFYQDQSNFKFEKLQRNECQNVT